MFDRDKSIEERYTSFKNIDCYKNASLVLDAMNELFAKEPESKNALWDSFMEKIPDNYHEVFEKGDNKDTLYLVCSNVFYIFDLFEEYEFDKGIELMDKCELECC
jgi:hypothetical protein